MLNAIAELAENLGRHIFWGLGDEKTPTPLDRMSLTVCSIAVMNAFDASWKSKCASSRKNTSLGLL